MGEKKLDKKPENITDETLEKVAGGYAKPADKLHVPVFVTTEGVKKPGTETE